MRRRDPLTGSLLVALALVLGGFVAVGLGERIVRRTLKVYEQVPAVASGAFVGLALILTGCVFAIVQLGRSHAAQDDADADEVLAEIALLTQAMSRPRVTRSRRKAS